LKFEDLKVSVLKEDLDGELKKLQEQNALVVDKSSGVATKGDVVTIDYVELDDTGQEKANTRRESFVFEVGSGYNLYKIDEDLEGMKIGDERIFKKSYPDDFEYSELAGTTIDLKVKLNTVKEKQLPPLDDELAQDISDKYETLEDLKKDIRSRLKTFADQKIREHTLSQLLDQISAASKVPLPKSMVAQDQEQQWREFLVRFRGDEELVLKQLDEEGKTKEDILENWREASERRISLQLVVGKLVEAEKIEIDDQEVEEKLRQEADDRSMSLDQIKTEYNKNNYLEYLKLDMRNEKLYDRLLESATANKSKKIKFLDLTQGNY